MIVRCCLLACCLALPALHGEQHQTLWEKTLPGDVLAVVNADSSRVTLQTPGEETVSTFRVATSSGSDLGKFELLGSPHGVLLVAVNDRSEYVQLLAIDVATGEKLWQIACTELPAGSVELQDTLAAHTLSGVLTTRSQVIVEQSTDKGKMLVAYDMRTGEERWRSPVGGFPDPSEMMKQMGVTLPKLPGRAGRNASAAFRAPAFNSANYQMLPQRNILMKSYIDPGESVWEAVDLDTGQSPWSLRIPLPSRPLNLNLDIPKRMGLKEAKAILKSLDQEGAVQQPEKFGLRMSTRYYRGDYFVAGCTDPGFGSVARAVLDSEFCQTLRVYSLTTGQLAWELHEAGPHGWIATADTILIRLPQKIAAFRLATGEKLYELSGDGATAVSSGFATLPHTDGDWLFWFEHKDKSSNLVALDTRTGAVPWRVSIPAERIVGFLGWGNNLVLATTNEIFLIERGTGRFVGREKALGGADIRAISPLDAKSLLAVGDAQIRRFEVEPWKQVYATSIQEGPRWGALLALAAVAAMSQVRVPTMIPGARPGTFAEMPLWLSPQGMEMTDRLLRQLDTPALMKLEQRSSHYTYFGSESAVHRVDVLTGEQKKVASVPGKGSMLAIDESRGIGCLIRKRTLSAYRISMEDEARRTAQYGDGVEIGFSENRRASRLEAIDKAKATAAYTAATTAFASAKGAADGSREKAMLSITLGQTYDRLAVISSEGPVLWKDKAAQEYRAAADLTCGPTAAGLEDLCRSATELIRAGVPK